MNFSKLTEIIGWGQKRCSHCLKPFFPARLPSDRCATLCLCPECQQTILPYAGPRCKLCGNPFSELENSEANFNQNGNFMNRAPAHYPVICGNCEREKPPWNGVRYFGLYADFLRDLILRLKFDGELQIAGVLADFIYSVTYCLPKPDFLAAIPQFPAHLRKRGFNQAFEIAKIFAKLGGWKLSINILQRKKSSKPQEGLTAFERKENLKNAFCVKRNVKNKIIWLIDDVITSGATCAEAAKVLHEAGAKAVFCLSVARTPLTGVF